MFSLATPEVPEDLIEKLPKFDHRFANQEFIIKNIKSKPGTGIAPGRFIVIGLASVGVLSFIVHSFAGWSTKRLGGEEAHPRTNNKEWLKAQSAVNTIGNIQDHHKKGNTPDFTKAHKEFMEYVKNRLSQAD